MKSVNHLLSSDGPLADDLEVLRAEIRSLRMLVNAGASTNAVDPALQAELQSLRARVDELAVESAAPRAYENVARRRPLCAPSRSRVVVLAGPTGVGKTTTIAKLAARAALEDDRAVHLVSLDAHRVGADAQIRAFAELIGVPLTLVSDPRSLAAVIAGLTDADQIYVDTPGTSMRDTAMLAALSGAVAAVRGAEVHLTMPASISAASADACVRAHDRMGIARVLFTKLDEAEDLGEIVRMPARHDLPITWLTTGPCVPEDVEEATPSRLDSLGSLGFSIQDLVA